MPTLGQTETVTVTAGDLTRTALVYTPNNYSASRPSPILYAFHPGTATASRMASITGFNALADRYGLVVVYPQGLGIIESWNACWPRTNEEGCCGFAQTNRINDVGFWDVLKSAVENRSTGWHIHPRRRYLVGYSNGGMLAYTLAIARTDQVAALGIVASSIVFNWPDPNAQAVPVDFPKPLVFFHGGNDTHCPAIGGEGPDSLQAMDYLALDADLPGALEVAERGSLTGWFKAANKVTRQETVTYNADAVKWSWGREDHPGRMVGYYMAAGGHTWPGSSDVTQTGGSFGTLVTSVPASRLMLEFLLGYSLAPDFPRPLVAGLKTRQG